MTSQTARRRRFVSTAIPYVNAAPHVGFALEAVQADALARYYRQRGDDVLLQSGTDENSLKNVLAAEAAGIAVEDLVAANAGRFRDLAGSLGVAYGRFVRTSADPGHRIGVERFWKACAARGDLYRRSYSGRYCTGCEQFYADEDLAAGLCPEHGTDPETVEEENWFFRLSRYADALRDAIVSGRLDILPAGRRNEALAWIDRGLDDFSVSRSASRARGWGIPVPGDPSQVIYVWFDALVNYVTGPGYGSDEEGFEAWWAEASSREHVIGKGITRFHAVYWPAILLSAGLPLPDRILVHGYLTAEGRKIGKSSGNAIDPVPFAARFGADALRYYLLRHVSPSEDGDFSLARLEQAYSSELAGQLGNLANRVLSLVLRLRAGVIPGLPSGTGNRLLAAAEALPGKVSASTERFAFDRALDEAWRLVGEANSYVAGEAPWALGADPAQADRLDTVLASLCAALAVLSSCLAPFLPQTARSLAGKLGLASPPPLGVRPDLAGNRVETGEVLFPKPPVTLSPSHGRGTLAPWTGRSSRG